MIISVKVKAGAKKDEIKKISDKDYEVAITERKEKGKANKYLIKFLGEYFGKKAVLISGFTSKEKRIEII